MSSEEAHDEIRIVLADDHVVVRSALRMLLDAEPGLEVVAEAGNAEEALRARRRYRHDYRGTSTCVTPDVAG